VRGCLQSDHLSVRCQVIAETMGSDMVREEPDVTT
jgi:hypothetical protein